MKLQFSSIPASKIQTTICNRKKDERSLEEKFEEKKREILKRENRKLRPFHFVTLIHENQLHLLDYQGKVVIALDNPESVETERKMREIYVEKIRVSKTQEGGCYFN